MGAWFHADKYVSPTFSEHLYLDPPKYPRQWDMTLFNKKNNRYLYLLHDLGDRLARPATDGETWPRCRGLRLPRDAVGQDDALLQL